MTESVEYHEDRVMEHILQNYDLGRLKPSSKEFVFDIDDYEMMKIFKKHPDGYKQMVKDALLRALKEYYADFLCKGKESDFTDKGVRTLLKAGGKLDGVYTAYGKINIKLKMSPTIKMRNITPDCEGKPICFDCKVIGMDEEKTYTKECVYVCQSCDGSEKVLCDVYKNIKIPLCRKCKNKSNVDVDKSSLKTSAVQKLTLQERMEESDDMLLRTRDAKAYDGVVGTINAGQDKRIIGVFRSVPTRDGDNDVIIDIVDAEDLEDTKPKSPKPEEIQKYKEDAKDPEFFERVISYLNTVEGHTLEKKLMILTVIGGVRVGNMRGTIHSLFIGDASVAKSTLMEKMKPISTKSMMCTGMGVTAAGLTIGLVKEKNGTSHAELGVLAICNGGTAYIDEFDKMRPHDKENILQAQEQQHTGIAKAGFKIDTPTVTTVIAGANPEGGRWGKMGDKIRDNIKLTEPQLTRFDNIVLVRDFVDVINDTKIGRRILEQLGGKDRKEECYMNKEQMRTFLDYTKTLEPILTDKAQDKILVFFNKIRNMSVGHEDMIPISFRNLMGLARMSMAHAKLKQKEEVDEDDVGIAIELYTKELETFGINIETGEQLALNKSDLNREQTMIQCMKEAENGEGHFLESDVIEKLAQTKYFDEHSAAKAFENWHKETRIRKLDSGLWKRVT